MGQMGNDIANAEILVSKHNMQNFFLICLLVNAMRTSS